MRLPRPDKSGLAMTPLLPLRGVPIHRGDEAISVARIEIATPRQVGARNDTEELLQLF
jgi:hypothetical protein